MTRAVLFHLTLAYSKNLSHSHSDTHSDIESHGHGRSHRDSNSDRDSHRHTHMIVPQGGTQRGLPISRTFESPNPISKIGKFCTPESLES